MILHIILNLKTALDAEKCFDSIGHVSLFLKLINVLPIHEWLLLYNWYNKLNAVVKWNGSYSKSFCVTRGTRQGSVLFFVSIEKIY